MTTLAVRTRSGLEETYHSGAVAVSSPAGDLVASAGDIDRPFFLRSSAKPFQAFVSLEFGAPLRPLEIAIASASHRGHPVQIALVEQILERSGLSPDDLACPPDWPINRKAAGRLMRAGYRQRKRLWHNCSGKHSGFLAACVAAGLPTDSYLDPDHPLQRRIVEFVSTVGDFDASPVGVDGCGAPVLRTTTRVMARLFAYLSSSPDMADIFKAMHAYPAIVGGNGEGDSILASATNGASKGGALGCVGLALDDGIGVAAKSWDGLNEVADLATAAALAEVAILTPSQVVDLAPVMAPDQYGGGRPVGKLESRLRLEWV